VNASNLFFKQIYFLISILNFQIMNKKIFITLIALCVIGISAMNLAISKSSNDLANIVLADNEGEGGNNNEKPYIDQGQYPLNEYQHHATEDWPDKKVKPNVFGDIELTIKGVPYKVQIGLIVGVEYLIQTPACKDSDGNVCKKTHLDKKARFLGIAID
jgi:hypothetical protein